MICNKNNENQSIISDIEGKSLPNQKREILYKKAFYEDDGITPKEYVSLVDYKAYMNTFPNVISINCLELPH